MTIAGLGKMGLPIAMVFTHAGYQVIGYDISEGTVKALNQGHTQLDEEPFVKERLQEAINKQLFRATTDITDAILMSDIVITIIPILDGKDGQQDLSDLKKLYTRFSEIADHDVLFIQESTLAPGTSKNEIWPIIETNMAEKKAKFGLTFAPERTFSGRAIDDIEKNYPKLVGGINPVDGKIAASLYSKISEKGVVELSDATTAEAVKTFKGAYRDANIAIANQFAIMADKYGVDVLEVIEAANTEPYSHIHTPGIGVGGHCIPVYPKFLIHSSIKSGFTPQLLIDSRSANDFMVNYALELLKDHNHEFKNVLILGLSYRSGVKEYRNSPTLRLVPLLRGEQRSVQVYDPLFSIEEIDELFGEGTGIELKESIFCNYDTIIVTTDHREFSKLGSMLHNKVVYDGRYVFDPSKSHNFTLIQPGRLSNLRLSED